MISLLYEENGSLVLRHDAAELPGLMGRPDRQFWLNLEAPTPEEFGLLESVMGFHPIAVEDAARAHQRPKLDEYDGYCFLTADEVSLDLTVYDSQRCQREGGAVQRRQMSAFMGSHYLVTVQVEPLNAVRTLKERCSQRHHVIERGADFLLYLLLDALVDTYFPVLDALEDQMDELEDRIVDRPERGILDMIFALKRDLTRLRKFAGPLREVVQSLTTRDFPGIQSETVPYFRDVADHLFRIYEAVDGYRDLMSNMLDAYLSQVSNEMNRVMQRLSVVATVFLPITFITGVFGMNFQEQPWFRTNFWLWMALMACVGGGTYWWFHRRHLV
jgi:magnesium transporter